MDDEDEGRRGGVRKDIKRKREEKKDIERQLCSKEEI